MQGQEHWSVDSMIIEELGKTSTPVILLINKVDLVEKEEMFL